MADDDTHTRRPGLRQLALQLQRDNPGWTTLRCVMQAKVQWSAQHLQQPAPQDAQPLPKTPGAKA